MEGQASHYTIWLQGLTKFQQVLSPGTTGEDEDEVALWFEGLQPSTILVRGVVSR